MSPFRGRWIVNVNVRFSGEIMSTFEGTPTTAPFFEFSDSLLEIRAKSMNIVAQTCCKVGFVFDQFCVETPLPTMIFLSLQKRLFVQRS